MDVCFLRILSNSFNSITLFMRLCMCGIRSFSDGPFTRMGIYRQENCNFRIKTEIQQSQHLVNTFSFNNLNTIFGVEKMLKLCKNEIREFRVFLGIFVFAHLEHCFPINKEKTVGFPFLFENCRFLSDQYPIYWLYCPSPHSFTCTR